jgi:hypothetical protein
MRTRGQSATFRFKGIFFTSADTFFSSFHKFFGSCSTARITLRHECSKSFSAFSGSMAVAKSEH